MDYVAGNGVLADAAELAIAKRGVLGFAKCDNVSLRNLIKVGGAWSKMLHPDFTKPLGGYLLLIGKTELIPTFEMGGFNIKCKLGTLTKVVATDLPYAELNADGLPDLIVGRLIANDTAGAVGDPSYYRTALRSSIDAFLMGPGTGAKHGLSVCGTDADSSNQKHFIEWTGKCADALLAALLAPGIYADVTRMFWHMTAPATGTQQFKTYAPGASAIVYNGHGFTHGWDGPARLSISTVPSDFPLNLGGAHPVVLAESCSTAAHIYNCIAAEFLRSGAGAYIGAVPVSLFCVVGNMRGVITTWGSSECVGKAFSKVRRGITKPIAQELTFTGDATHLWWAAAFGHYGAPKFGAATAFANPEPGPTVAELPPSTLEVTVPDYIVTPDGYGEGLDEVTIPGGSVWDRNGDLLVPFYQVTVNCPPGYRSQKVTLAAKSGFVKDTGVNIPMVPLVNEIEVLVPVPYAGDVQTFFPERDFGWSVTQNPDGGSELTISIYALKYNPLTTDIWFHRNFTFGIGYEGSSVSITSLETDKDRYAPGENVLIDLAAANTGARADFVVECTVFTSGGSRAVADGLLLRNLAQLGGNASFSTSWNTGGFASGDYTIEAAVKDAAGNALDRRYRSFAVGIWSVRITAFTAAPQLHVPGNSIAIRLDLDNAGTEPVQGDTVITVRGPGGEQAVEFVDPFDTEMHPSMTATHDWIAGSLPYYHIAAVARYRGMTTDPVTVTIQADSDGDGVGNFDDNCPDTPNPEQTDADGDGIGNACDACPGDPNNDWDGDGICGNADNAPDTPNPDQADADGDDIGDACDVCPHDPANDADVDGFCSDRDNCPGVRNPDQADADSDGIGDACDPFDNRADVNGDCQVNVLDMILVRNHLGQAVGIGDNWRSDANRDGKINVLDMIFVRNRLGTKCPKPATSAIQAE